MKIRIILQLFVFAAYVAPSFAQQSNQPPSHALSLAAYSARGDFGLPSDTTIRYLPVRYEFDSQKWGAQLLVPYLQVEGPGAVLINLGGVNRAVAGDSVTRESGVGDIVGSLIYHLPTTTDSGPFLDLRMDIKVPTADENRGLGSGKTDLNLQLDASQYWREYLLFASVGYSFRGNSSLYPDLGDGAYLQLGAARSLSASVSMGALFDYREAASALTNDIVEAGPYLNWQINDRWSLTGFSLFGFTDSSVDFSVLGQLRYSF